jgi:hypothetical protein
MREYGLAPRRLGDDGLDESMVAAEERGDTSRIGQKRREREEVRG